MDYELIFMDMYGNPTNMYAIFCMNRMKKKFLLSVDGMLPRKHENPLVYMVKKYCLKSPELVMSPGESDGFMSNALWGPKGKNSTISLYFPVER